MDQRQLDAAASAVAGFRAVTNPPPPTGLLPNKRPFSSGTPEPHTWHGFRTRKRQGGCLRRPGLALGALLLTLGPSRQLPGPGPGPGRAERSVEEAAADLAAAAALPAPGPQDGVSAGARSPTCFWTSASLSAMAAALAAAGLGGGRLGPLATASGIKSGSGHSWCCCRCVTTPRPLAPPGQ